jgi:tetratricopeptide (TPR) repeat protein
VNITIHQLLGCILVLLTGCAPLTTFRVPTSTGLDRPLPVPFIAQQPGHCGPAALAMVARYYGRHVTQEQIGEQIYLPAIHGVLTTELAGYAGQFGFWVRQYHGSQSDLRQKLHAGIPLIVLGKFGRNSHYFIVTDIDTRRNTVTVHSDSRPHLVMPLDDFLRHWTRAGHWTMLVCPPDRATWRLNAAEHNDLGLCHERAGRHMAAAGHYAAAAELDPSNSYYRVNLGNAYLAQDLYHEAAGAYAQAVKLAPDNADALNNLAWAYAELGANLDEAVELCTRAIKLRPAQRAGYLDTLGWVYLKQGKSRQAANTFEEALAATSDLQSGLRRMIRQHLDEARRVTARDANDPGMPATGH